MNENSIDALKITECPKMKDGTLVLSFSGWMDGGDVSTGTVQRLVDLLEARQVAHIDPEPFYIYNFPGSMEVSALFRPHIEIESGIIKSFDLPTNSFYCDEESKLMLFVGKEPNLQWHSFADCLLTFTHQAGIKRILFVGSFGGAVPHTREPRLYITCSNPDSLHEMEKYGLRKTDYEGPGSFTSYLMTQAKAEDLRMDSIVAEIPGYLQGTNPMSIEAVTRRLAKILQLPLDIDSLRSVSTEWELEVSSAIEDNDELSEQVRQLENEYDTDLLEQEN
ncbi:MAG: PAC2 family protein [Pirellulaceae bacterium]|nr:PAC2 family protein [Pirellulaceae bacterium]